MIKLVAFDWNGTLLADTQTVVDSTNVELKTLFKKSTTLKEYRENFVIPVVEYFKGLGIDPLLLEKHHEESAQIFSREYESRVNRCRTRFGAKELLHRLKSQKIKSVIFSNHTAERITEQTDRLKITNYFGGILGNSHIGDAYTIKGKERRLIEYIAKNKINPSQILIVGDTDEEIIIGRDMGAKTAAITGGHSTTKRLRAQKPDFLINSLTEIMGIIKKLNS